MNEPVKILIVDDSRIFRNALAKCLSGENDIKVIGSVHNGEKALEFLQHQRPDLITLDIEMPGIGGLETLMAIQEFNRKTPDIQPIGVIIVSALSRKGADISIQALTNGAFDFITKPQHPDTQQNFEILHRQMVMKIRFFISKQMKRRGICINDNAVPAINHPPKAKTIHSHIKALLIGVSTGGPKALMNILPSLCDVISIPIFIVQHMPPQFTLSLAESLNQRCSYTVKEATDSDVVLSNHAYIAPGGKHMLLGKSGGNIITIVNEQPPDNGCRPSVNALFHSAAIVYGGDTVSIILTGMGNDGTKGIRSLKRKGSIVLAQDEESSVVWGMPGSAVHSGCVDEVVSLNDIPVKVSEIIQSSLKNTIYPDL